MTNANSPASKSLNIGLWILQALLAAAFLMAGLSKLMGQEMMVENFEKIGLGQWFRYLTGAIEVIAAVLLLLPRFSAVGALLLVCTMLGATAAHLTSLGGSPVPPLVLGSLAAIIAFGRRHTFISAHASELESASSQVAT